MSLSLPDWVGAVANPTTTPNTLPVNSFQAQAAGQGTGPTSLNEQDYMASLVNPAISNQQTTQANQAALLAQFQAEANGTGGPNIAQQQLQQGTQANAQAAASAMASARGVDPALAARQIGNEQASINQNAAGQAATLRLQQEQAAMQAQAGLLGQQQQGNLSELGTGVSANQAQNSTNLQNLMGQQALDQATGTTNAELQSAAQAQNKGLAGYAASAAGGALNGAAGFGAAAAAGNAPSQQSAGQQATQAQTNDMVAGQSTDPTAADVANNFEAAGGQLDHNGGYMLSPGEDVLHHGHMTTVPGHATVPGNSLANDTVPANLMEGDIVIPREIAHDPNPAASMAFIETVRQHHKTLKDNPLAAHFSKWMGGES